VKFIDVGVEPVGFIAIGASATGVIAIGELATGVFAVGQLARGVVTVGQLSLGFIAIGQLSIGVAWALGQLGIAALAGPGIVFGVFGRFYPSRLRRPDKGNPLVLAPKLAGPVGVLRLAAFAAVAALWIVGAGKDLTNNLQLNPTPDTPITTTTIHRAG
jgi:hypothetical protein